MSNDDYAVHILQKYRLAITLAVIKTKPENLSIEEHIEALKSKLNPQDMDFEDLNISINSEDFKFDETDNIFDNFNEVDSDILQNNDKQAKTNKNLQGDTKNERQNEMNILKTDLDDVVMYNTQDLNESITILDNFKPPHEEFRESNTETGPRRSQTEVIDILKGIDDTLIDVDQMIIDQSMIDLNHSIDLALQIIDEDLTQCYGDIQMTQCDSIDMNQAAVRHKVTKTNKQPIIDTDKPRVDSNNLVRRNINPTNNNKKPLQDVTIKNIDDNKPSTSKSLQQYRQTKEYNNLYLNVVNLFDTNNKNMNNRDDKNMELMLTEKSIVNDEMNSQNTTNSNINYTQDENVNDLTQEFTCITHYSQSQDLMQIDPKLIRGNKRSNLNNETTKAKSNCNEKRKDDIIIITDEVIKPKVEKKKQADDKINKINKRSEIIANSPKGNNLNETEEDLFSQDIFSQDLPYVLLPSNNAQRFDGSLCFNKNQNQSLAIRESIGFKIDEGKNAYDNNNTHTNFKEMNTAESDSNLANADTQMIDSQMFITQSQPVANNLLAIAPNNNNYVDSLGFQQYNKKTNFTNRDDKKREVNRKLTPNFNNTSTPDDDQFESNKIADSQNHSTPNAEETKFYNSLQITTEIYKAKGCTQIDRNVDVTHLDNLPKTVNIESNKKPNEEQSTQTQNDDCTNSDNNLKEMEEANTQSNTGCINFHDNLQDMEEDNSDNEAEKVPFKTIEELNKVKVYLNRRNERSQKENSGDTGYRSDISAKPTLKISQTSSWVDQSAHSLYSYIATCSMVSATRDIVREISLILGQLIDRLHEEEKYPAFLDEILNLIQTTLGLIYEDDTQLKQKDEYIHRIILVNRSIHVQKYTIEKITEILENLYKELTATDSEFEMKHIEKMENTCQILHLLEILLTKHKKSSSNLSQNIDSSTQNTQDLTQNSQKLTQDSQTLTQNTQDNKKSLKNSSIMAIWRKKWNPNYKEVQNVGSQEKECEIEKCCAILNKIIVDCFEGYSLISYLALKCFNVMQNN